MRKQISVTPSEEIDSKRKLVDVANERVHTETELRVTPSRATFPAQVPRQDVQQSAFVVSPCSVQVDVEPHPGPPRAWSRGGELFTADITAETATKYRRAFDDFDMFLAVRDMWFVLFSTCTSSPVRC